MGEKERERREGKERGLGREREKRGWGKEREKREGKERGWGKRGRGKRVVTGG